MGKNTEVPEKEKIKKHKKEKKSKKEKKEKKGSKKRKRDEQKCPVTSATTEHVPLTSKENKSDNGKKLMKIIDGNETISLCLFYQYVEPAWNEEEFESALKYCQTSGDKLGITGRMRVGREGLNCTITGSYDTLRAWTEALVNWRPENFSKTEFKFTDGLPMGQRFPNLKAFEVVEIVNYGLAGARAPSIKEHGGTHLEPEDYHKKMEEGNTVIIDVRNHYEAQIGKFQPPKDGAEWIDPEMRKSTEFPVWLDKSETKEKLKGKQVLMYCTGGIRCERASALLKQKIETEPDMNKLGIKGVFQLQGGIDKYFKKFEDGGHWKGKNYVFDKRFAHIPSKVSDQNTSPLSKCEKCHRPWDQFRNKRRCPTCGVPSLVCLECFAADPKIKKDRFIRCDLCVKQNITSKSQWRAIEENELKQYEANLVRQRPELEKNHTDCNMITPAPNPENITRLFLGNMCTKNMNEDILCELLPEISHLMWLTDRKSGNFFGKAFVEMATPESAAMAVAKNGTKVLGRPISVKYQKADPKDRWPPPNCKL